MNELAIELQYEIYQYLSIEKLLDIYFIFDNVDKYLQDNFTINNIIHGGCNTNVLESLVNNGCKYDDRTFVTAVRTNNIDVIEWLFTHGCQFPNWLFDMVITTIDITTVKWLFKNGFRCNKNTMSLATQNKDTKVFDWLLKKNVVSKKWSRQKFYDLTKPTK